MIKNLEVFELSLNELRKLEKLDILWSFKGFNLGYLKDFKKSETLNRILKI